MEHVLFRYSKSGLVSFRFNYTINVEIGSVKSFRFIFVVQNQLWLTVLNCNSVEQYYLFALLNQWAFEMELLDRSTYLRV